MKVSKMIDELSKFNKDAEVKILALGDTYDISFAWSSSDGDDIEETVRDVAKEKQKALSVYLHMEKDEEHS